MVVTHLSVKYTVFLGSTTGKIGRAITDKMLIFSHSLRETILVLVTAVTTTTTMLLGVKRHTGVTTGFGAYGTGFGTLFFGNVDRAATY